MLRESAKDIPPSISLITALIVPRKLALSACFAIELRERRIGTPAETMALNWRVNITNSSVLAPFFFLPKEKLSSFFAPFSSIFINCPRDLKLLIADSLSAASIVEETVSFFLLTSKYSKIGIMLLPCCPQNFVHGGDPAQ